MVEITAISPLTIAIKGELDTAAAPDAESKFDALGIDLSKDITFDLSQLTYISSSGLRLLLAIKKRATAKGGEVKVVNMTETVTKIFKLIGFDSLFCH